MAKLMLTGADMNNQRVVNVGAPSSANDATTKTYVDNLLAGLSWKDEVKAATTAALAAGTYSNGASGVGATFTATGNGAMAAVDGETAPALNDRYLIKNQVAALQNGIYFVSQVGTGGTPFILTRVTDADTTVKINNATVAVTNGTANGGLSFTETAKNPVIGTDSITFTQYAAGLAYTAGNGLTLSSTTFSITSSGGTLTPTASNLEVALAASGGLTSTGGVGIKLASTVAGLGLTLTSGVLDVVALDSSLTVNANDISVNVDAAGGIETSTGVRVKLNGATLTRGSSGMSVTNPKLGGNGSAVDSAASTVTTVTHNLGTSDIIVQIRGKNVNAGIVVEADVLHTSINAFTVTFPTAVSAGDYRIVYIG